MIKYERDPKLIQKASIKSIREKLALDDPDNYEHQILARMIYAYGDDNVFPDARISSDAIASGLLALKKNANILCDSKMVMEGLKHQYLNKEPICLIDRPNVISQAKAKKITRAMVSVDNWKRYASGSIVLIGNEATALLHLMELLEQDEIDKPALIIGMPRGYLNTVESKQYLWDNHQRLGIPCMTVCGTKGGSALTAAAMNGLIYLKQGVFL
ncbi:precorrin-8X methylmutase [Leucothrix sargassi]|nr:precorrin-8X methylmutase [Leucothrix sargassi]